MRTIASLTALMLALLVVAAPLALAGAEDRAAKGKEKAEDAKAADAKAAHAKTRGHGNLTAEDDDGNDTRKEKRAGLLDAFRARMAEWRASWKENATAIREACHAAAPDADNATKEERKSRAHCIRDGYHQLFAMMKLERKAWKDERKALHE